MKELTLFIKHKYKKNSMNMCLLVTKENLVNEQIKYVPSRKTKKKKKNWYEPAPSKPDNK